MRLSLRKKIEQARFLFGSIVCFYRDHPDQEDWWIVGMWSHQCPRCGWVDTAPYGQRDWYAVDYRWPGRLLNLGKRNCGYCGWGWRCRKSCPTRLPLPRGTR